MSHTTSRDPSVTPSQSVSQYNEGPPTYTDLPHHSQPAMGASDVEMRSNYARKYRTNMVAFEGNSHQTHCNIVDFATSSILTNLFNDR